METVYSTPEEIFVNGDKYMVQKEDHVDQVFYHITKDGESLCTIGLNENAEWEADSDIDESLVKALGDEIDKKEL